MPKVYIGVGHGGSDPGAVSGSHKEKIYALDIATACTAELKRHGISVMQSRTIDENESAAAKIKECNSYNPDIALDIHLNVGGGDGFEVFCSVSGGKGKNLAQKIEAAVKKNGQNSRGVKTKRRADGKDYFGIIRQTNCPAVLVECAFIDSSDVQIVDTLAERQKMGVAIARGILDYFGISTKTQSTASVKKEPALVAVKLPEISRQTKNNAYTVKRIQTLVSMAGFRGVDGSGLAIDGDFGANTEHALRAFQTAKGTAVTGKADAATWRMLILGK